MPGRGVSPALAEGGIARNSLSVIAAWGAEEPGSELSINPIDWTSYVVPQSDTGKIVFLAVSPAEGGFYLLLLAGPIDQAEAIQEYLYLPILQNFSVSK